MDGPAEVAGFVPPRWFGAFPACATPRAATPNARREAASFSGQAPAQRRRADGPETTPARHGLFGQFIGWARESFGWPAPTAANPDDRALDASIAATDLLQDLLDALHEEVALLDDRGVVLAANRAWRDAAPSLHARRGGLGAPYLDLCAAISSDLRSEAFHHGVRDAVRRRTETFTYGFDAPAEDHPRRRLARITPFTHAGAGLLIVIHEDAEPRSQPAADDVLSAQDEERQRLAIELHDSTSQHLVALALSVARLRRMVGAAADDVLEDMSKSIAEVVKEIRLLSFLKRPPGLQRDGLAAAVPAFVRGFGSRTGIETLFSAEGDVDAAPPAVQHAAFRILQESFTNVYRHAAATRLRVELEASAEGLTVRVIDNGRGVAGLVGGSLAKVSLGVGITGMQARARQLGGRLEVASDGGGATVTAILPFEGAPAGTALPESAPRPAGRRAPIAARGREWRRQLLTRLEERGHGPEQAEMLLAAFEPAADPRRAERTRRRPRRAPAQNLVT